MGGRKSRLWPQSGYLNLSDWILAVSTKPANSKIKIPKGVSFPPDLLEPIQVVAEREDRTFSSAAVQLIRRGLEADRRKSEELTSSAR